MRLPADPCRVLGGKQLRKKDRRVAKWETQINPGKKRPTIRGKGSYKRVALRGLKKSLEQREIKSPELRNLIADRFRK